MRCSLQLPALLARLDWLVTSVGLMATVELCCLLAQRLLHGESIHGGQFVLSDWRSCRHATRCVVLGQCAVRLSFSVEFSELTEGLNLM
jgi:hypothetical protein